MSFIYDERIDGPLATVDRATLVAQRERGLGPADVAREDHDSFAPAARSTNHTRSAAVTSDDG